MSSKQHFTRRQKELIVLGVLLIGLIAALLFGALGWITHNAFFWGLNLATLFVTTLVGMIDRALRVIRKKE